jgi:hypothetical protein
MSEKSWQASDFKLGKRREIESRLRTTRHENKDPACLKAPCVHPGPAMRSAWEVEAFGADSRAEIPMVRMLKF